MEDEGLINEGAVFIDGTKIEADANRYTFVWRKAVEKYHEKLKGQAVELYDELITKEKEVVKKIEKEKVQTSQGLEKLARETEAEINQLTEEFLLGVTATLRPIMTLSLCIQRKTPPKRRKGKTTLQHLGEKPPTVPCSSVRG